MGGRITRGWRLAKVSLGVLRRDRTLGTFPILSGITAIFAAAAFWIPAAFLFDEEQNVIATVLAAVGAYAATYVAIFFAVALAGAANMSLDGKDTTVGDGIAVARQHVGAIAGWAAITVSVNIILQAIRERFGFVGDIIAGLVGAAWGLVTFLVVPIIAIEGLGPVAALKRSGSLFRQRWGEQIVGQFSISGLIFLVAMLPAIIVIALGVLSGNAIVAAVCITVGAIVFIIAAIVAQAASGIFGVALYRYAAGLGVPAPFHEEDLATAVGHKRGGRFAPGQI